MAGFQELSSCLHSNFRQNSSIWLVEAGNLLSGLEFTGENISTTNKHLISDSRDVPRPSNLCHSALINRLQAPNRHFGRSQRNNSHPRKHGLPEYSYQVQMLIHAALALNWFNYLLEESIKGLLSILQIGFSKVKLNCVPFQLITKNLPDML